MERIRNIINLRQSSAVLSLLGLIMGWLLFIRAVDTGSLQQYGLLILLIGFTVNRLFRTVFPKKLK